MLGQCTVCMKIDDLRPYGKNGSLVCFPCGMKDEEEAKRQFSLRLGDGPLIVVSDDIVALSQMQPRDILVAGKNTEQQARPDSADKPPERKHHEKDY